MLRRPTETDTYQATTYTETELSYVRFEPLRRTYKTKENTERVLAANFYYDCVNSRPRGLDFMNGDHITAPDGTDYEVRKIEHLYDRSGLHHIELELM